MKVVSAMDLEADVRQQLFDLLRTTEPTRLMVPLRDFASKVLAQGYPREQLLEDFEYVRAELRWHDDEVREDVVMDVMDFLHGWSSSHMKL
jgi:hypothetical protein